MKVGDLVKLIHSLYDGYGIITNVRPWPNSSSIWYTVHWQDGRMRDTYEADELQLVSEDRSG